MPLAFYVILSLLLFIIGNMGFLLRRNALISFMSLELMFNAANLLFVAFASFYQALEGQIIVFFVMTIAAAEVAIGLALMVAIFRSRHSIDIDQVSNLKG